MANLKKFTRSQVGHILKHCERAKDEQGNYIKFGNENIDTSFTSHNYNLATRSDNLSDYEFIKSRCKELKALNRKDVNVACSWVVTIPQEYYEKAQATDFFAFDDENLYIKKFFNETYSFLKNRYGEKNIVSSYVHLDETTPHMHFIFTPAVWDKAKSREKISAKELIDKRELLAFHPALNKALNKALKKELAELDIQDVGVLVKDPHQKFTPSKDLEMENKRLKKKIFALEKENQIAKKTLGQLRFKSGKTGLDFYNKQLEKQKSPQNRAFER